MTKLCVAINDWRPIETAPTDGTPILACDCCDVFITWWMRTDQCWFLTTDPQIYSFPNWWQPLPRPPEGCNVRTV